MSVPKIDKMGSSWSEDGETRKITYLKWNIDPKLTKCAVIKTIPAFLTSTVSKNIVA